jgi:hypothetical protein
MRRLIVIMVATALIAVVSIGVLAANPDIGGDPIHAEKDYFSAGDWGITAYSYVFDNTSTSLPGLFELDPGEMLFMYLLDCDTTKRVSVEHFSVGNPQLKTINTVGFENTILPSGYDAADFEDPYIYGYSGTAEATIFTYYGDFFDPWCTLDPGEYSLVYYIAVSRDYGPVNASADAQGLADTHFVPGPLCVVGFRHFAIFAEHWLDSDCNDLNNWCAGADINYNGDVNSLDLNLFTDEWLNPCPDTWPLF